MAIPTPEMYFPLDGNANNTEGTNGTATGVSWVTGLISEQCAEFNSEGDGIEAPEIDVTTGISISCWVNIDSTTGETYIVSDRDQGAANTWSYLLRIVSGTLQWYVKDGGGNNRLCTFTPSVGMLYHVVATWNGTNQNLYINGSSVSSDTGSGFTNANNNTYIGCRNNTGGIEYSFDGKIDEVGIWLEGLSNTDVTDLYNSGNGKVWNGSSWVSPTTDEVPTVTTQAVTSIGETTATGNGNITDLGSPNPTQHGVCWNTTGNPDINDSKTTEGSVSSTGAFTSSMTGLAAGQTYYVRAYATNSAGTSYGSQVSFTTEETVISNVKVMQSGSWNTATVKVRQSGSWVTATAKTRQSGGWN